MHTHIMRTGREDVWSPAYSTCVHRRMYSVQCFDKIRFPQLQAPMVERENLTSFQSGQSLYSPSWLIHLSLDSKLFRFPDSDDSMHGFVLKL